MFNFEGLVSNVLLEQDQQLPDWFNKIIKKHDEVFGTNISDGELNTLWSLVAGKSYVADRDIASNFQLARIIDLLSRLYNIIKSKNTNIQGKPTWEEFKSYLNSSSFAVQEGNKMFEAIKNATPATKELWQPLDPSVRRGYEKALADGDKLSSAALTTYDGSSVVQAVQQIINKRINVFTRVAKLKNPKTPFSNLIQDVFKQPELYLSGQKKYSSDFEAIDDLYIKDIIKVAMAAKDFYASEIAKLKMQQTEEQTNILDAQMRLPGFENTSLNLFDKFVDSMLVENNPLPSHYQNIQIAPPQQQRTRASRPSQPRDPRTGRYTSTRQQNQSQAQQQNQPQQQFNKVTFDKLYDAALKDVLNRLNFLSGKPVTYTKVDNDGKETGQQGTTDPAKYTIGNIRKMESNEARELVNALQDIALYTKKRPGASERVGQRLQALGSAGSNIAALAGAKLYG